jgi:kynurenine formamidase
MARKLIDLTQEIYNGMPVYPGHQRTVLFDVKTHEETREMNKPGTHTSTVMGILMCDHGPTHVDAFIHVDPRFTRTSTKADIFVRLRSGTALVLCHPWLF